MIKLKTLDIRGFNPAIHGMRNPKNSWDRSDSHFAPDCGEFECFDECFEIGQNDMKLAKTLASAGSVHAKYRRMMVVWVDITAPLYWWKEFDTYKVGTVANSCSTMHKIAAKPFEIADFSYDHLGYGEDGWNYMGVLDIVVDVLNKARESYLLAKVKPMKEEAKRAERVKFYWWQMIQLLPSSYNQRRTVMLNYEVLANICKYRRGHKLDEWREFIEWARKLPYAELFL